MIDKVIYSEIKASTHIVSAIKPNKNKYIKYNKTSIVIIIFYYESLNNAIFGGKNVKTTKHNNKANKVIIAIILFPWNFVFISL